MVIILLYAFKGKHQLTIVSQKIARIAGHARPKRAYGITFISDKAGIAANGSRLGKGYSAHVFNDYFLGGENPFLDYSRQEIRELPTVRSAPEILPEAETGDDYYDEPANYLSPFMDAWEGGAQDQLQGQIASAKIPLSRMISPALYWVMMGDDFSLDINNPKEPKILVVGNNPDRQNIYSAALGLYNSRIVKLINKKKQLKSSVIIDELPTIYFRGLDNLIATARSNKVAVCLGFQDFSQLTRDYGDKESKVIQNTVGNVFSGQVVGETAKTLSERFGKVLQQRQSMTINRNDKSTSISTQMDSLIPASKISNLTQGMFVGAVSDNFDERIEQKIFHAEIVVDSAKISAETKSYKPIPVIAAFTDESGQDSLKASIDRQLQADKAGDSGTG